MLEEKFRTDFMCALMGAGYDDGKIRGIMRVLDSVLPNYVIDGASKLPVPWQQRTLECLKYYLATCKSEGYSLGTLKNKQIILLNFLKTVQKSIEDITALDIRKYLCCLQMERNITNVSLEKYRQMINAFFVWCVEEEYLTVNPCAKVKKIKGEQKRRDALTQLDLELLRKACKNLREKAILELLYSTGCRIGEVVNIKISDIDWQQKTIRVVGKGNKERLVYINAKAEVALKDYLASRDDSCEYLLKSLRGNDKITTSGARIAIEKIAGRVEGLSTKVIPHKIRHTTATQALKNGMTIEKVSKLLGHSQISTTMLYADVDLTDLHNEHTKCVI